MGSMVCGNFVTPRTFTVNGTTFDCASGRRHPSRCRNGGWCFEASAGNNSYAYFATYNASSQRPQPAGPGPSARVGNRLRWQLR